MRMQPGQNDDEAESGQHTVDVRGTQAAEEYLQQRVTELEAEVTALRAEAARGRLILRGATDYAIVTLDGAVCVTGWNEGARRALGYEEAEILGRSAEVWFLPEDRAASVLRLEMCRAQGQGRAENERWHLRKDGTRSWASGLMMPAECGGHAQTCLPRARHQCGQVRCALCFRWLCRAKLVLEAVGRGCPLVEIAWRERGGPPVRRPERRGFGSRLLERGLTQEFGGTVRLDFAPAGLECDICLPLGGKADTW